jgi:N-acetylglucosaminyl-diphospho-decaprenol L-rhamnosyltransferase
MDLSIIIVNWNSKEYLKKCLQTLYANVHDIEFEIVVIDGASFDGCDVMLAENYPDIHFVQSYKNSGFAKANNEAFKVAKGRNLLFLNPDTEVKSGAIYEMLNHLNKNEDVGIVGAKLFNTDGTIQNTCIRVFPSILNQILDAEVLIQNFPKSKLYGLAPVVKNTEIPISVDAVSGACLMIRRAVFEFIEMFSTEYFMYSEDIDICYKAMRYGWKTHYVPKAIVVHHGGGSCSGAKETVFSNVMMLESRWRYFKKYKSVIYCLAYRLSMVLASATKVFLVFLFLLFVKLDMQSKKTEYKMVVKKLIANIRWGLYLEKWVNDY